MNPNNITRAIVDATVDRGLREIAEDPQRSIRKLTDMGRQFTKGRFLQEVYAIVQELLRNDDCPYYTAIEHLLRYTSRKSLKDFGINVGYNSLTFGGKIIRQLEAKKNFKIPWTLILRINPTLAGSITASEIESCITQGRTLGIYSYIIRCEGSLSCLKSLLRLFAAYKDCAFICFLPDQELTAAHLNDLKSCTNTMFMFAADMPYTDINLKNMRRQKSLYGIYGIYDEKNVEGWLSGSKTKNLIPYESAFVILLPADTCLPETRAQMAKYIKTKRLQSEYPFIMFDLYGDAIEIDRILSSDACYFELLENGSIGTPDGVMTDFRHTTTLEQMLSIALPKDSAFDSK